MKLASLKYYVEKASKLANFCNRIIEIKKNTFERNAKSKVFVSYGLEDEAREINNTIFKINFSRFKYTSYKLSASV